MLKTLKFERGSFWHILPAGTRLTNTLCRIFVDDDKEFTLKNVGFRANFPTSTCPECKDVLENKASPDDE